MSDIALRWGLGAADLVVEANDVQRDEGLETSVLLSLFCDRRAQDADRLPDGHTDRRGWWGDAFPAVDGDQIGSRLWLLSREKETTDVLRRAEAYAREALTWLLEDRVAASVDVTAAFPRSGWLGLTIVIVRPLTDAVTYRFNLAWAAQAAEDLHAV